MKMQEKNNSQLLKSENGNLMARIKVLDNQNNTINKDLNIL